MVQWREIVKFSVACEAGSSQSDGKRDPDLSQSQILGCCTATCPLFLLSHVNTCGEHPRIRAHLQPIEHALHGLDVA